MFCRRLSAGFFDALLYGKRQPTAACRLQSFCGNVVSA
jgi:hypothetical protein